MSCIGCGAPKNAIHKRHCPLYDPAPVGSGDVNQFRLELDDHPSQGGSRARVSKSNSSLSGLDSRRDDQLSRGFSALLWFALILGFCIFGAIVWVLISFGIFLIQLNP